MRHVCVYTHWHRGLRAYLRTCKLYLSLHLCICVHLCACNLCFTLAVCVWVCVCVCVRVCARTRARACARMHTHQPVVLCLLTEHLLHLPLAFHGHVLVVQLLL